MFSIFISIKCTGSVNSKRALAGSTSTNVLVKNKVVLKILKAPTVYIVYISLQVLGCVNLAWT